jgi:hypothetical protein
MSEKKRNVLIVVVLVLVVLFGVGQFFAYSNPPSAANTNTGNQTSATQVIAFVASAPVTGTPVEQGTCFANSIAAPYRADAWRCMVGNAISDPCFEIPGSTSTLACGINPTDASASSSAFTLHLTGALPTPESPTGTMPTNWAWRVKLGDGGICSPFTGTRPFTASGDVAVYSCSGGTNGDLIFGDLNNASAVWTAEVGSLSTATSTFPPVITSSTTVPVAVVWQ